MVDQYRPLSPPSSEPSSAIPSPGGSGRALLRAAAWIAVLVFAFLVGARWNRPASEGPGSEGPGSGERAASSPIGIEATGSPQPPRVAREASHQPTTTPQVPAENEELDDYTANERRTIELFRGASPAVVNIDAVVQTVDYFRRRVFEVPEGRGSGFVWDDQGHIVTNYHVVSDRRGRFLKARVTLWDQSVWDAEVVGGAIDKDLAVIKIDAPKEKLRAIPVGRSSGLVVGQSVYAIGNPFGLDYTLTTGVVSALGREIDSLVRVPIRDVVQTDAAINPGNSGGPLLNSSGELIGVNTQIYSPSGASAGIGFAIPVDTVSWVVSDLIRFGEIRRPEIGLTLATDDILYRARLSGALVMEVFPGSAAERAGIRPTRRTRQRTVLGDIIVAIDGRRVRSRSELEERVLSYQVGDQVELTLIRDGEEITVPLRLGLMESRRPG